MNAVTLTKPIVAFLFSVLLSGHIGGNAEVKYIPAKEGRGVFNVVYNNPEGSRFVLQILDQDGNQLYQNVFADKKFTKNFQLADPDSYNKLVFVIRNLDDKSSQRWEVSTNTQLIEDVNVREVR
jgi:hypothetical protein